jgi:hypothetical protein
LARILRGGAGGADRLSAGSDDGLMGGGSTELAVDAEAEAGLSGRVAILYGCA